MTTTRTCVPEFVIQWIEETIKIAKKFGNEQYDFGNLSHSFAFDPFQFNMIECAFDVRFKNVTGFDLFRPRCFAAMKFNANAVDVRSILEM